MSVAADIPLSRLVFLDTRGHLVGRAVLQYHHPNPETSERTAALQLGLKHAGDRGRVSIWVEGEFPRTLELTCSRCPGRSIQASGIKVVSLLKRMLDEGTRGPVDYRVG